MGVLDFERSAAEEGYKDDSERKYPVIADLVYLSRLKNVVPSLVKGIKVSDSEVLRTNAAETLLEIDPCVGLTILRQEADRGEIPVEQKERLEAAAKYIVDNSSFMKPCEAR